MLIHGIGEGKFCGRFVSQSGMRGILGEGSKTADMKAITLKPKDISNGAI